MYFNDNYFQVHKSYNLQHLEKVLKALGINSMQNYTVLIKCSDCLENSNIAPPCHA